MWRATFSPPPGPPPEAAEASSPRLVAWAAASASALASAASEAAQARGMTTSEPSFPPITWLKVSGSEAGSSKLRFSRVPSSTRDFNMPPPSSSLSVLTRPWAPGVLKTQGASSLIWLHSVATQTGDCAACKELLPASAPASEGLVGVFRSSIVTWYLLRWAQMSSSPSVAAMSVSHSCQLIQRPKLRSSVAVSQMKRSSPQR
mmetsp:Transcript_51334/g.116712  ORF Transcript_51334/g.116712 Transcript_51334/m.116712 type:complete len:203 (-) Transcript_51334:2679-3287(-)